MGGKRAILAALGILAGCAGEQHEAVVPTTARGEAVMVVFFTTWCPASVDAVRAASKIRGDYAEAGLVAFAVDVGDSPADVARFTAKHAIDIPIQRDDAGKLAARLELPTVPAIVVMDRDGAVRHVQAGYHGDVTGVRRAIDGMLASTITPAHASKTSALE